jgi:hypothetical protein
VGGGVQLGLLSTAATNRPIVPAPGDYDDGEIGGLMIGRGNPTCCPDANPRRRGGKPATNRLSYGTAIIHFHTFLSFISKLPYGFFPTCFPSKVFYTTVECHAFGNPRSAHSPTKSNYLLFREMHRLRSSSLFDFLQPLLISNHLGPDIFPITLLKLCESMFLFEGADQVSPPHNS